MKRVSHTLVLAAALASAGNADTVILTLNPSDGALSGQPGQTVGWGFTIEDDTFFLTVAGTGFCANFNTNPPDSFPCANPVSHGTYQDFTQLPNNFFQSSPGMADTSQQNFSYNPPCDTPGPCTGTGAFTIDADNTLIGQTLSGVIVVDYNLFDANGAQQGGDNFITANALVRVIPEPGTLWLMAIALAGFLTASNRRRLRGCVRSAALWSSIR